MHASLIPPLTCPHTYLNACVCGCQNFDSNVVLMKIMQYGFHVVSQLV